MAGWNLCGGAAPRWVALAQPVAARNAGIIPAPRQVRIWRRLLCRERANTKLCLRSQVGATAAEFLKTGLNERTGIELAISNLKQSSPPDGARDPGMQALGLETP